MNLTPEEKFNKDVWYVLKKIKERSLYTKKSELIEYQVKFYGYKDPTAPPPENEVEILEKLQEWGVIRIRNKEDVRVSEYTSPEAQIFYLGILQPAFDKFCKKWGEIDENPWLPEESKIIQRKKLFEERRGKALIRAKELGRQFEELDEKQKEKEAIKREVIEELKTEQEIKNHKEPFCVVEKGWGYLKFDKYSEKVKIGKPTSRHFRLLECLLEPFGKAKTIESVYEWIKLPKDKKDSDLSGWDNYKKKGRQITIIQNTIKEIQKGNKFRGKLAFEFDDTKSKIWIKSLE